MPLSPRRTLAPMNTRREFLARSAAGLVAASATARADQMRDPRPNVVIIVSDDHGYGDFSCFGNPILKTPNFDKLHDESLRLRRFYVCPVCAPTRANLFTGRYAYRSGVVDTYVGRAMMDPAEHTLAESLQDAGYATGLFGKWHLGDSYPLRPMDRGFDESLMLKGGGLCQPSDPRVTSYFDPILWRNGEEVHTKGYCTDVITDAAINFIRTHANRPFFTALTTNAPHNPLDVDDRYAAPYRAQGVGENDARVYGMIANLDENLGRLLATLDEIGQRDNTIVIFFTDNGAAFTQDGPRYNAGLRNQKGSVYEGGVRVPCFIRWPKALAPADRHDLAAAIDLMPTLLDACRASAPRHVRFDGKNLLPALRGDAPWPQRTYFTQWHRGDVPERGKNACAIAQRYKLVESRELYDLEQDRAEAKDIAAEHPDLVAALRAEYDAWFDDVCATRSFAPVPITVGSRHENPTWLTAQDMRGVNGWGPGDLGAWHLDVARSGRYTVALHWLGGTPSAGTRAQISVGERDYSTPADAPTDCLRFEGIKLPNGRTTLAAALLGADGKRRRPDWVLVTRER